MLSPEKTHFVTLCPAYCDTLPRCGAKCHKISFLQKIVKNSRRKNLKIHYRMHFASLIYSFLVYQALFKNIDKEKFLGTPQKICDTEPRSPLLTYNRRPSAGLNKSTKCIKKLRKYPTKSKNISPRDVSCLSKNCSLTVIF